MFLINTGNKANIAEEKAAMMAIKEQSGDLERYETSGPKSGVRNVLVRGEKKCLEFSDLARKLIRKTFRQFPPRQTCAPENFC